MFVFVLSSQRSRIRALPQDLSTRLFCVWFCTKHLCFALEGQGMACGPSPHSTGRGLRPSAVVCCHRPNVWPAGTIDGRPAIFFWSIAFLAGRLLCICFCRYFCAAGIHCHPLHTRVWRDCPLVSFLWKLYKTNCLLKRTSSLLFRG